MGQTLPYLAVAATAAPGVWYCLLRSGFWRTLTSTLAMFAAITAAIAIVG